MVGCFWIARLLLYGCQGIVSGCLQVNIQLGWLLGCCHVVSKVLRVVVCVLLISFYVDVCDFLGGWLL